MFEENALVNNRYRIVKEIARGGMGVIYLAEDEQLKDNVALKVSLWHDENLRKAFEREALILAKLKHANLPSVRGHFFEDKLQCLVMEFIEGENLREKILNSKIGRGLPFADCLKISKDLCQVVEYLHSKGILHRDIKPENIKQTSDDSIVLLDFGLAKSSETSVLGNSMGYAAVEQISNLGTNERSDIYSIGATLYHLLSGEIPIPSVHRLSEISDGKLDPLFTLEKLGKADYQFSCVVAKAMALKSENRFATVKELLLELENESPILPQVVETNEIPAKNEDSDFALNITKPINTPVLEKEKSASFPILEKTAPSIISVLEKTQPASLPILEKTEPSLLPIKQTFAETSQVEEIPENEIQSKPIFNYFYLVPVGVFIFGFVGLAIFSLWLFYPNTKGEVKVNTVANLEKSVETTNSNPIGAENQLNLSVGIYWIRGKNQTNLVAPEHIFRTGDKLRFNFTAPQNGFLHIVTVNPDGYAVLLFPTVQMPEKEKIEVSKISKDKENFFPNQDGFEYGETPNTTEAYSVDKIYFVFADDYHADLLTEIRETMSKTNNFKNKKYSSQDFGISINDEKVKSLLEKLANLAQKVDGKTKEINFFSNQKILVGYLETRSGGR